MGLLISYSPTICSLHGSLPFSIGHFLLWFHCFCNVLWVFVLTLLQITVFYMYKFPGSSPGLFITGTGLIGLLGEKGKQKTVSMSMT